MRLAIIGTGKITEDALTAIHQAGGIAVAALWARPHSRKRGEELASEFGIPEVCTDYDELLEREDIDTVYITLINSAHYEYARRALKSGKNVILEKPFTVTLAEAEDLYRIAGERGLFLFEAITVVHNRIFDAMREMMPKLGDVRVMQANYSQYSSRYDRYLAGAADPVFDPACSGGALRDINIYNIHFAAALFGAPLSLQYYPNKGYNGVDTSGVLIMEYRGFKAVCTGAKDSESACFVMVQGENGYMKIDGKPNGPDNLTTAIRGLPEQTLSFRGEGRHRMTDEFADFSRMIDSRDHDRAEFYERETLEVMRIIRRIAEPQTVIAGKPAGGVFKKSDR